MFASAFKPPHIAPNKNEVAEIVAIMEDESFDTAAKMARKIMSTAYRLLTQRNWFVVANFIDEGKKFPMFYGMFATEAAALKALESNSLGLIGMAQVVEINGLTARQEQIDRLDSQGPVPGCANCGHQDAAHNWPRVRRIGCIITGCDCQAWVKPAPISPRIEAA